MRLLSALATTALFLATPLFSSRGEETPTAKAAEKAKFVIGTVVTPDGSPVEGAEVRDCSTSEAAATTPEGVFVLPWPETKSGCHGMLFATKGTNQTGWNPGFGITPVESKDAKPSLKIVLEKMESVCGGDVVDESGNPIEGATVQVDRIVTAYSKHIAQPIGGAKEESRRLFWNRFTTKTDKTGHFEISLPPASKPTLIISAPGKASLRHHEMSPGEKSRAPLVMPPGGEIRGKVMDKSTGTPLPRKVVRARWPTPSGHVWENNDAFLGQEFLAVTDEEGNYDFLGLRLGEFEVGVDCASSASPSGDLVPDAPEKTEVSSGKVSAVNLTLSPGKRVAGKVLQGETENPFAVPMAIRVTPGISGGNAFWTKEDGTFETYLHPGQYKFELEDGSNQFPPVAVDVKAKGETLPVTLRSASDVANISVKIRTSDGKFINNYDAVRLWQPETRLPKFASSMGEEFLFSGVRKGQPLRVIVDVPGYGLSISQPFAVGDKSPEILLTPVPQFTLTGTILDAATGKALEGAWLGMSKYAEDGIRWEVYGEFGKRVETDKDGRFAMKGLRKGDRIKFRVLRKNAGGAWESVSCGSDATGAFSDPDRSEGAYEVLDSTELPPATAGELKSRRPRMSIPEAEKFPPLRPPSEAPVVFDLPPGGMSVVVNTVGEDIVMTSVVPGGPGDKAGLHAGDRILEVDGKRPKNLMEAVQLVRGDIGTKVKILVQRRGQDKPQTFVVERAAIVPLSRPKPIIFGDPSSEHGADPKALTKITLPENATKEQVKAYIEEICLASGQQNILRSDDPQIKMLEKVGHANLNLLIENLSTWPPASFYVLAAIKSLVLPEDRDQIIANLSKATKLIEIVQEKSWAAAAKDEMWKTIQNKPDWIPNGFVLALASLSDPATYEDLSRAFSTSYGKYHLFEAIRTLPNFDLKKAVDAAWEYQKTGRRYAPSSGDIEDYSTAVLAARYGHRDALDYLFKVFDAKVEVPSGFPQPAEAIRSVSDIPAGEDLATWYKNAGDKIRFDEGKQRFIAE